MVIRKVERGKNFQHTFLGEGEILLSDHNIYTCSSVRTILEPVLDDASTIQKASLPLQNAALPQKDAALPTQDAALPQKGAKFLATESFAPPQLLSKELAPPQLPTKELAPPQLLSKELAPPQLPTKELSPPQLPTGELAPPTKQRGRENSRNVILKLSVNFLHPFYKIFRTSKKSAISIHCELG